MGAGPRHGSRVFSAANCTITVNCIAPKCCEGPEKISHDWRGGKGKGCGGQTWILAHTLHGQK